ncbi:MAG: GGDEF domain-containing protein, partial [Ruminococcus sp.]|nr:GGDEF domain-containing protein [Ruminococcus sp.]
FGHSEGDFALKAIANIMKRCFRGNDIVARIGGDEYAALAFVDVPDIQQILRKRITQYFDNLNQKSAKQYYITVSVGMYKFNCGSKVSLSDVMKHTDESLIENKKNKPSSIMKPTKLSLTI